MKEPKHVRSFIKSKIVQIIVIVLLDISFFASLIAFSGDTQAMIKNKASQSILLLFWVIILANIFFIFYDFYQFRKYRLETSRLNKAAYIDELTGLPNRYGLDKIFYEYNVSNSIENVGIATFSIKNLVISNEHIGRYAGDKMIQDFSSILESVGDDFGIVGRNGSNDFIAIIDECTEKKMEDFISLLLGKVIEYNNKSPKIKLDISHSYVLNSLLKEETLQALLVHAYKE